MVNAIGSIGNLYNTSSTNNSTGAAQQSLTLPNVDMSNLAEGDTLNLIGNYVSGAGAGAFATFKGLKAAPTPPAVESKIGDAFKNVGKAIVPSMKNAGKMSLQGAKFGALFGGVTSIAANGYQLATGQKSAGEATGGIVADTMTAAVSGAGGAFAGVATGSLLKAAGVGAKFSPIIGTVIGVAAAAGIAHLAHSSGVHDTVSGGVSGLFGEQQ